MDKRHTSATHQRDAARARANSIIARDLLWALVASHTWPSCLMPSSKAQENLPYVMAIDTPGGRLVYRITKAEADSELFAHLSRRPNDHKPADDKDGVLLALAQSCTFSDPTP